MKKQWEASEIVDINICETATTGLDFMPGASGGDAWKKQGNNGHHYGNNKQDDQHDFSTTNKYKNK